MEWKTSFMPWYIISFFYATSFQMLSNLVPLLNTLTITQKKGLLVDWLQRKGDDDIKITSTLSKITM